jgi:hypothetical protein
MVHDDARGAVRCVIGDARRRGRDLVVGSVVCLAIACSNDRPPAPKTVDADAHRARTDEPTPMETTTAHRAHIGNGADLYVPPWFRPKDGGYDLVVHFHGLRELQEKNLELVHLNAVVVSVNLGVGTDPYSNAFRDPKAFTKLLDDASAELEKSGRGSGAKLKRLALSAWSAGFVSVQRVIATPEIQGTLDAVLIADGFFTSYSNLQKKTINPAFLASWAQLAEAAQRGEKLLVITHTSIPTTGYPSTTDTAAKLLELASLEKTPSSELGPKQMKRTYVVDKGDLHVHGYAGVTAGDHVNQLRAAGETIWPYLATRWSTPAKK